MEETIKLNQGTAATAMEATDTLLFTDSSGSMKRITRANLIDQGANMAKSPEGASVKSWIRLGKLSNCYGGFLVLTSNEWAGSPRVYTLAISSRYKQYPNIRRLTTGGSGWFKVRIVANTTNDSESYLEVYDMHNRVTIKTLMVGFEPLLTVAPEIPAGFVSHEYTNTELESGVCSDNATIVGGG